MRPSSGRAAREAMICSHPINSPVSSKMQRAPLLTSRSKARPTAGFAVIPLVASLPPQIVQKLQEQWPFHIWREATSEARLITSFDTQESDVTGFAALVRDAIGSKEKQWT